MIRIIVLLCFVFLLTSCDKFEYNVYETNRVKNDPSVKTQNNIDKILQLPEKDTLKIIFTGDTQRYYDDLEDLVEAVNEIPGIDAVVITGDLADFGAALEYELINRQLKMLKVPFITAIGNHDCLANGTKLYEEIYGALNYSFTWNGIRFVVHNTNGREFNFNGHVPDLNWMEQQLADSANYEACIFVSHVPPYSDDFDPALENAYTSLIRNAKNTIFSSNGHRHDFELSQPYQDSIWYLNTSSPANRIFSIISITENDRNEKDFTCIAVNY
jgi:Icc protein